MAETAKITNFGLQSPSTDPRTLYATWSWSKDYTNEYKVMWYYTTGNGVWFVGSDTTTKYKQSTYNAPDVAKKVKFKVKPVAKKKTQNGKQVARWTAGWSTEKIYDFSNTPPQIPTGLTAEINGYKLTASLDNQHGLYAKSIEFQVIKEVIDGNTTKRSVHATGKASLVKDTKSSESYSASYIFTVSAGPSYEVRCRSVDGKSYSQWSDYVVAGGTVAPAAVKKITVRAIATKEVKIDWDPISNASDQTQYEIQYTTKERWFNSSEGNVSTHTVDAKLVNGHHVSHAEITGLELGNEYFFRLRAKNGDAVSNWTPTVSIILGKVPEAPTTWSNTTAAVIGEYLYLYWIHNSEDGSSQKMATLELTVNNDKATYAIKNPVQETDGSNTLPTKTINKVKCRDISSILKLAQGTTNSGSFPSVYVPILDSDDKDKTTTCIIDTSDMNSGANIKWRVKTAGILEDDNGNPKYGSYSASRLITLNVPPSLSLDILRKNGSTFASIDDEIIESFPFYISGEVEPNPPQKPIGYYVTISSMEKYWSTDSVGNDIIIGEGQEIYSTYINSNGNLRLELTPDKIDLQNNISYKITCTVSMSSGLTGTATKEFTVFWSEVRYEVDAEISIDYENLTANIRPYCISKGVVYCLVNYDNDTGDYIATQIATNVQSGVLLEGVLTTKGVQRGKEVYLGIQYNPITEQDEEIYYYEAVNREPNPNVMLSVYRREYDGSFVEIQSQMTGAETATDPHPSLDFARYRIVSVSNDTGATYFYDVPPVPVNEHATVFQWSEQWSSFGYSDNPDVIEQPSWAGSMLKLPYNIDISTDYNNDSSLIAYIGRKHPVSYYGTQRGESATWKVDIPANDIETLYAIRRLAVWMGDVYVREPSGSGYWANVSVSFSKTHCQVTIPVSFKITRVEGGI